MKKIFLLVLLISLVPLFAEEEPFNLDMVIQGTLPEVDKQIKKTKTTSCVGKWVFKEKSDLIEIECLSNGAMQIKQTNKRNKTFWKGVYTVSSNTILFHVHQTITKQNFNKTTIFEDYYWPIAYKATGPKQMTFYSSVEPNSFSRFSYTSERIFKKVRS